MLSRSISPEHIMIAESEEFFELQKENFEEKEKWQKNLKEITDAMKKKRDALKEVVEAMKVKRSGEYSAVDIRVLVMVLGGGMQGAYGAGQMSALQEMGYASENVTEFDAFLGISGGAATCAFGLAGKKQALLGTSYFYTICTSSEFINFFRLYQIMNVSVIDAALREGELKLDVDAVKNNPAKFYTQAYNENSSQPEFINAKDPNLDMISVIHASMALPVVYNKAIEINGSKYTDGAFDDPMPIVRAIKQFQPSHVLILPNIPFNRIPNGEPSKTAKMMIDAIPHAGSLGFIRKVLNTRQALRQTLEIIAHDNNVKIGVAWPPEVGIGMLTKNKEEIKTSIKEAAKDLFVLFGEPERELKLYEEEYLNN